MVDSHKFEIVPDARRSLLRITMRGHWATDTVEKYRQAVLAAIDTLLANGCERSRILALVEATDLSAQSQAVVAEYKASMIRDGLLPRRLATVLSSTLFKLQVDRIAAPNQQIFANEHDALEWLLDDH